MPAKRALSAALALLLAVSFVAPSGARALSDAGFEYTVSGGAATVEGCTSTCPTTLVIPATLGGNSVTTIGDWAFSFNALTSVTIPDSVTTIGDWAFSFNALTSVTIGNSVTTIGDLAFYDNDLTTVTIPDSVTSIGDEAFAFNELTSVTIGNSVTTIGDDAFYGNFLTSVTIPDSVTTIGDWAFSSNALTSVTIGNSVTTIGDWAFAFNALTSVTFLGNAPTAGADVFLDNSDLDSVTRSATATGWGATWSGVAVTIAGAPSEVDFEYTVSGGAATVTGCTSTCPTTLVIPDTLGDNYSVTTIGDLAFAFNELTSVTIPNSVTSIGGWAFSSNDLTSVSIPNSVTTIGDDAFYGNFLTSVTIPDSVTTIGDWAFSFNALTSVTIGNSVTTIGDLAFAFNELTSVTIPNSVTTIGDFAFEQNFLTAVTFLGNAPTAGDDVFAENSGLDSVTRSATATGWGATWSGVSVVIAGAPRATVKPTVRGTARVGKTLTAAKGTWTESPTFQYQWYACTKAVSAARTDVPRTCKSIKGATRSTFKLTSKQRNKFVAVRVTGTSVGALATTWLSKTATKIR